MKSRWTSTGFVFICALACGVAPARTHAQGQGKLEAPPPAEDKPAPKPVKPAGDAPKPRVVEEVVARVNNEVITTVDLERNKARAVEDVTQECQTDKCTPEELQKRIDDAQKDALRDLIDQSLLVQRAKDMDISVETDLVKELDELRQDNKLATMEDLEKAITDSGQDFEEFKEGMRKHLLVDQVIYQEVGSRISAGIDRSQMQKYYEAHKSEFVMPEGVRIREILVSTEGKPQLEWPELQKKAESYRDRVLKGEDFGDLAKAFSDGSSAKQGGELGGFERGKLDKALEEMVFKLNRNEMTPVIQRSNGFLIIQVETRFEAGIQPFDKVENEVMNRMAQTQMAPKLREYLATLRRDSFVEVRPGYVDTSAVAGDNSISEAKNATNDDPNTLQKKPKKKKKLLIF
jgi:peptidyl-prolyl cis-trans isomerase SurA